MDAPSRTVEDVFKDFRSRREGIIKALTTDVREFYRQCDPEKENLCLYGFPNESWEVNLPAEEVPPELPEPVLGINFSRDGMSEEDWVKLVAVHSDSWLISLSFYFGIRFGFDKNDRLSMSTHQALCHAFKSQVANAVNHANTSFILDPDTVASRMHFAIKRLFNLINGLPSIYEVVTGKKETQEVSSVANNGNSKRDGSAAKASRSMLVVEDDDDDDEEDEHKDALCGACGMNNTSDQFWICCDLCETWFHGKCVKITPAKAQHIKQYKCPGCSNKKIRVQ